MMPQESKHMRSLLQERGHRGAELLGHQSLQTLLRSPVPGPRQTHLVLSRLALLWKVHLQS